jgi:hypothetical protein
MELGSSLPHLQEPATCLCPESDQSSPCSHFPLLEDHFNIIILSMPRSSKWWCEVFCSIVIFYSEELLAPLPTPSWRTTPCHLPMTAYSVYLQLPLISRGCSSSCYLRMCHAVVTGTAIFLTFSKYLDYSVTDCQCMVVGK